MTEGHGLSPAMTTEEVLDAIREEGLDGAVWFSPKSIRPNGAYIEKVDGAWKTFMTDERAVIQPGTVRTFSSESEALSDFLDALRVLKRLADFHRRSR